MRNRERMDVVRGCYRGDVGIRCHRDKTYLRFYVCELEACIGALDVWTRWLNSLVCIEWN